MKNRLSNHYMMSFLPLTICIVLKSPSEINIATPTSFWLLTTWYIFQHPFPSLLIYLKLVFHTQHMVGSHIHIQIYILSTDNLCLLIGILYHLHLKWLLRLISNMFITVFYLLHLFSLFPYFSASSDINWYFIWFYLISSLNISVILLLRNVKWLS